MIGLTTKHAVCCNNKSRIKIKKKAKIEIKKEYIAMLQGLIVVVSKTHPLLQKCSKI